MEVEILQIQNVKKLDSCPARNLLQAVLAIEKKTFPKSESLDILSELKKQNAYLSVAVQHGVEKTDVALGHLLYIRLRGTAILHKVCVTEEWRRQGVGKRLLQSFLNKMSNEGCRVIQLWVDDAREPAKALYESFGFAEVGRVENYYGPGRTGIKMELQLD